MTQPAATPVNRLANISPPTVQLAPTLARGPRRFTRLMATALLALAAGCQSHPVVQKIVDVPPQSFVSQWTATVVSAKSPVRAMYIRGDTLFVYSDDNHVYVFSAGGGKLLYSDQVIPPGGMIRPPLLLPEGRVAYPTTNTIEIYGKTGRRLQSLQLNRAIRGPGVVVANTLYIGLDSPTGGRLAALDLSPRSPTDQQVAAAKRLKVSLEAQASRIPTKWEVLTIAGIDAAPVVYQGVTYAASADGQVWAVNEQGSAIWSLPGSGGNTFKTDGPIFADLKVDDVGVYAASEDGKLYCIDRGTGRVKWQYYGGTPLDTTPVVTATTVYQYVRFQGLVAIDKQSHNTAKAKWVNERAVRYLGEDDKYVYAQQDDGYLLGLDKLTGVRIFRGQRKDFQVFAPLFKDATVFAATKPGEIFSVKSVLRPGTVGELVLGWSPIEIASR